MKAGIKTAFRIIAFILLLALLLYGVNSVLLPKYYLTNSVWPTTSTYRSFYTMNRNSVDVLFLGSSICVNSFIPQEIYDLYGIRSYNLGSEQQSVFLSYFWLKEALRYQSPSVVVLEGCFLKPQHPDEPINTTEGLARKCLDQMRLSPVKIEAVNDLCAIDPSQNKASWYLTNIRFHDRWKSLSAIDFDFGENSYSPLKGWAPGNAGELEEYTPFVDQGGDQVASFDSLMVTYFEKIAELCRQKGIKLVVVNLPFFLTPDLYHAYQAICLDNGADYLELSLLENWNALDIQLPRENPIGHGNIWGNIKVSRYIGKLLSEQYRVPEAKDPQYENTRPFYEQIRESYSAAGQ